MLTFVNQISPWSLIASRTLTVTEHKYFVVEKEALACMWATEKWRTYLWGQRFANRPPGAYNFANY